MPTERLSMRKTREILRLKWLLKRSHREIRIATGAGLGTISDAATRAIAAQLDWATVEQLSDDELEARLYPAATAQRRPLPDPAHIHIELRRPGVTLRLLHEEYLGVHADGYGYTQFVGHYRAWAEALRVTMRQVHRAGDKVFVDYSGRKPTIVDPTTGERTEVELFVAVLGASNYTYAEATRTQRSHDWIESHLRLLEFLGGVPRAIVPDQLKSGVVVASRYDPSIQRTYEELAQHYGTTILPARPAHPRDKAKVENGVLLAQRWILARLRNQTFFSLDELNLRIADLVDDLNDRVMRRYGKSRRQLFAELDCPALGQLRPDRFVYGEWKHATVNLDYHIEFDHHYYSVPYPLVHQQIEVRANALTVEVFHRSKRVASHVRSYQRGGFTTNPEHMPAAHRKHAEWTPERITAWAAQTGPHTRALAEAILAERRHPEHGFRSCLGIMRLAKRYGVERVEAACRRALVVGARSYRCVESILRAGLDAAPLPELAEPTAPGIEHENLRGADYYR
jgi:transposase